MRLIPWSRRRTQLATGAVLLGAVAALIASAVLAQGYPVQQVSLNDGGIWVTSDHDGLFGRLNKPAGELDAGFYPPGTAQAAYQLDILQDGAAVAAWDQGSGKLYPVDVDNAVTVPDQAVPIPSSYTAQIDGGTLATLDPATGKVRAETVDQDGGIGNLDAVSSSAGPLATVGAKPGAPGDAGSAMAVGVDGTVYAVSGSGRTATIPPAGAAGPLGAARYGSVGRALGNPRITAVGDQMVVLDDAGGTLIIDGGPTVHLDGVDGSAQLQAPSPQAGSVYVATSRALLSVDLTTGQVTVLWNSATGAPAAPVQLSGCVYAAWAATENGYVSSCAGIKATPGNLADKQALVRPEFRQNRGQIVLNDLASGAVWDLGSLKEVDDWASVKPPPVQTPQNKNSTTQTDVGTQNQPPKAQDVTLGARADRTTVLHLLDGCSDPGGNILSITALTQPDNQGASVAIAPDGQTALITLTTAATGDAHFKYTVDDGKGMTASANVTVQIRGSDQNTAPNLRTGYTKTTWTVPSGGHISLPVLADWRDYDGDPLSLSAVSVPSADGAAVATSDGFLDYTAPATGNGGTQTITYQVSDGHGGQTGTTVQVAVQSPSSTKAIAPTAEPNVARGQVGQPIVVHPLQNAVPGFDPSNPGAQLALAGQVASPDGTTVGTDLTAGTVTVTATRPGTFLLDYTIAFGDAPFGKGTIRVDVVPAPATPAPPVAMPSVAVLHGQLPATVDVLANDYDPSGALLAVQGAEAVATDDDPLSGQLQVAVVDGRWLRINATSAQVDSSPRLVRYTVTDGLTAPVTGEVSVTELPSSSADTPVVVNGYATVRAGDSATISVLDDDFDPDGATLTLAADIPGAPGPGQLRILSEAGTTGGTTGEAYVTGTTIRYVAPAAVTGPVTVIVQYVVQNALGNEATGQVFVTVDPPPSAAVPNRAPDPQAVQVRAVAGQTITIPIPTDGVDPDGDSVSVTGISSATAYGRVMGFNATTITYQAFPSSGGTDEFGYTVEDPYGATGTGMIQVAVVPPAAPQPPVAVDDTVTAAPGAHLAVNALSQDIVTPGDTATLVPLAKLNPSLPGGSAALSSPTGAIDVVVPPATGKPLVVTYGITDGTGDPSTATLTVFPQPGYQTPPVALDSYQIPTAHAASVSVDVRPQLSDPDSAQNPLTVSRAFDPRAQVSGGRLVLPTGPTPRTFAYEVKTPGGATTVGVVHVAGTGAGAPVAKQNTLITVPENGSTTVSIGDYVSDPAGKPIRLTTDDQIFAAPAKNLVPQAEGIGQIKLTASNDYVGPAALTFQVTDGTSLTDPAGHTAMITVQVQVGPQTPVLRCPDAPISLVEGGRPRVFDVTSVCYVWTADPATAANLSYTASWVGPQPAGVTVSGSGGHQLTITPGAGSVPGSTGTLKIGVVGSPGASSQLSVQITAAAPPTVSPVTIDGVKAGQTATVNLAGYVSSELYQPVVSVVSASQSSGMAASISSSGSTVRITPGAASHGVMTFNVTVTDVPSHTRKDRQTVGQITLNVLGVPDAPGQPTVGTTVLSRAVQLSWPTPANNGAPIDSYQVSYSGGQQTCAASPCTVTGLTNGTHYTFTVKAHNLVGWGQPSPASAVAIPNTIPDAVTDPITSDPQNGTLKLAWTAAHDDGTPVLHYSVSWTGGGQATVSGTSVTATGLDNNTQYTFTIIAVNAQGPSPATTVQGQSAGAPAAPAAPKFTVVESADANSRAVSVSWNAVSPNGPGPTTYTLTRTGGSGGTKTVCTATAATSCDDDGLANNGTVYTYTVKAANADVTLDPTAHTSPASPGTQMTATATPGPITNMSVTATGSSDQAIVKFDAPPSHGATSTVTCTDNNGSCGSWTFSTAGEPGQSKTIGNLTDGESDTVKLQDCNGSSGGQDAGAACDTAVSATVTAYGPMSNPKVTASVSGTTVNWTVSVNPNGKAATATITHDGKTTTETTTAINSTWSFPGSDSMGYSSTDKITLSVASPGRPTVTASGSATTGPKPALSAKRGALCNTSPGSSDPCKNATASTPCTNSSCGYVHITTTGMTGSYQCTFVSPSEGGAIGPALTFTGDQNIDTKYYFGYPGAALTVTCDGISDTFTWP